MAGPEAVLGRDPSCEILVEDPRVSRRHARILIAGGTLTIEDLGSTGGTTVNGRPVQEPVQLAPGDVVRVGDTELRVTWRQTAAPTIVGDPASAPAAGAEAAAAPPAGRRRRLVAVPIALFAGVSLLVYGLARWQPFEKEAAGGAAVAPGDATRGQAVFTNVCAGCHGAQAQGGVGPALAGNPLSVDAAVAVVRQGRGVMPAGLVTGRDEADVAAYLATILAGAPPPPPPPVPAPAAPPTAAPPPVAPPTAVPPPAPAPPPAAPAGDAARGRQIFVGTCAGCHGENAEGGVGPALAGNPIGIEQAVATIRSGRGVMPAGLVTGPDEEDVAAHLTTILASP